MSKNSYKETLNLPKTDFPMEAKLTQREPETRRRWKESNLYQDIRRARRGAPKYILHDGPPYANGDVHAGTGLNKVLKDIVVRYKTMRGFDAPFIPGWDCHGLPIEHRVVKELGAKAATMSKSDIRKLCLDYAARHVDIQRRQFKSLGVLGDWENPYLTYDPRYEVAIVELFEELWKRGHIAKKNKPIHWCMVCETALAEAELEYKNIPSPSIYVRFRIDGDELRRRKLFEGAAIAKNVSLLIWTTTPWTLPANVATALHPTFEYSLVETGGEQFILCKETIARVAAIAGWKEPNILATATGKELLDLPYAHPLWSEKQCRIVNANYIRTEDGTGCVHTAPGHGEEDYRTGLQYNLPVVSPVDKSGTFTEEAREFAGKKVFDANPSICRTLTQSGALLQQGEIAHDYPCCWRCKEPVIFRATEQWFILVDENDGRRKAIDAVRTTAWVPAWGEKRIGSMLAGRPDWCISRQRSWGVPIPAFYCASCGKYLLTTESLGAIKALFAERGANGWFDTAAEKILPPGTACPHCRHTTFTKETDIFDVWFESAASHRAVCMKHPEIGALPVDLYLEGTDQHRGWFQVSLLASILSQEKVPFKTVVTHGFLVDARTGDKLSKSGFLIPAEEVVAKLGADIFRLWVASIDYTDDIPISWEIIAERNDPYRKIRNTFRFLLGNTNDFNPASDAVAADNLLPIDRWALTELDSLIRDVTDSYERFEFFKVYHRLSQFCIVELSSVYFAILKDRLYTFARNSRERRSAQTVLHRILCGLAKMFSPIIPHTAEEIWSHIPSKNEEATCLALARWPAPDAGTPDAASAEWESLFRLRNDVLRELEKLRAEKKIGSSLEATVALHTADPATAALMRKHRSWLEEFLIVSAVTVADAKPTGAVEGKDIPGLFILAERSGHPKCARCWNLRESVGTNPSHPDICGRCVDAVGHQ